MFITTQSKPQLQEVPVIFQWHFSHRKKNILKFYETTKGQKYQKEILR
jgi:hypothetical protein